MQFSRQFIEDSVDRTNSDDVVDCTAKRADNETYNGCTHDRKGPRDINRCGCQGELLINDDSLPVRETEFR